MVFWLAILAGVFFAWHAVKSGFYDMWVMLFNIVISVYLAVFLAPVIIELVPATGSIPCGNALTALAVAIGTFLILYGISYTFITGQFSVSFPKMLDILFAGLMGFLAGFLVFSFVAFLICVTPISQKKFVSEVGFNRQSQQANISYISWWCDLVHNIVASEDSQYSTEQAINWYLQSSAKKAQDDSVKDSEHKGLSDFNDAGAGTGEENQPIPSPGTNPGDT